VKKRELSEKQLRYISRIICKELKETDLRTWQKSCKSLAPPNYSTTTRVAWYEENKFRVGVGRWIIDFVDKLTTKLQKENLLSEARISAIRSGIVKGIRDAQKKQKLTQYLLNEVKLSALRTLVMWTDNPDKLDIEENPIRNSRVNTRKGRKKEKGRHVPPRINLVREWELIGDDCIRITLGIFNDYIHPYQNVDIELDVNPNLVITKVQPYSWIPDQKVLRIGFIEANLGVEPFEEEATIEFRIKKKKLQKYKLAGIVHYDNCDKGVRNEFLLDDVTIGLS
jgi:hypothetical protein